jgi:hypothetical protein
VYDSFAYPPEPVADVASDVLADLYRAVSGQQAKAIRAYHDDDALLLLLRFDPSEVTDIEADGFEQMLEGAFVAMPGMICSAIAARSGHRMTAGSLSVCAQRGLAVFAFNAVDEAHEHPFDDELFSMDAALAAVADGLPPRG